MFFASDKSLNGLREIIFLGVFFFTLSCSHKPLKIEPPRNLEEKPGDRALAISPEVSSEDRPHVPLGELRENKDSPRADEGNFRRQQMSAEVTLKKGGYFEEVTSKVFPQEQEAWRVYAVDLNQDSWTDLVVIPRALVDPVIYLYKPGKRKFEKSSWNPIPKGTRPLGFWFVSLNQDLQLDLVVLSEDEKSEGRLNRLRYFLASPENKSSTWSFTENPAYLGMAITGPIVGLGPFDFNGDRQVDFYLVNSFSPQGLRYSQADQLYVSRGPWVPSRNLPTTANQETEAPYVEMGKVLGSERTDMSLPGLWYSLCWGPDKYPWGLVSSVPGYRSRLWEIQGGDRPWKDLADQEGNHLKDLQRPVYRDGKTSGLGCADMDMDGDLDILHSQISLSSLEKSTSEILYIPEGKALNLRQYKDPKDLFSDNRLLSLEVNGDLLPDLFVENYGNPPETRGELLLQTRPGVFERSREDSGIDFYNPQGAIRLDWDRDGQEDLVVLQSFQRTGQDIPTRMRFFQKMKIPRTKKTVRVHLEGQNHMPLGNGSFVKVITTQRTQGFMLDPWDSPLSGQHEDGFELILQEHERIKEVIVHWPHYFRSKSGLPNVDRCVQKFSNDQIRRHDHRWVLDESRGVPRHCWIP